MRTALGRVRGLGSARAGAHTWWLERLTSVSTLVLFVWFLASLVRLPRLDHEMVVEWLASPAVAIPMLLLILSTFWHIKLGLQVLFEDYVHDQVKVAMIVLTNFLTIAAGLTAAFSVLKIAFGAEAQ